MFQVPTHIFNAVMGSNYLAATIWLHEDAQVTVKLLDRRALNTHVPIALRPTSKQVYDMVKMIEKELEPLKKLVYTHPDAPKVGA